MEICSFPWRKFKSYNHDHIHPYYYYQYHCCCSYIVVCP
uniref:Uncharacterized protein n=1 Tax=Rhizophora mucronata TaxID=61149 RepID=A0A2P2NDX6_RHIMU